MDTLYINQKRADLLLMKKDRLLIIGAGELGRQVRHYANIDGRYECVGYVDDTHKQGELIDGICVLGCLSDIPHLHDVDKFDSLFIAFGYKCLLEKQALYDNLKSDYHFATIVAAPQYIDSTAKLGQNVLIYPGVIIDKEVVIGDSSIINLGAVISHNSIIEESCFIGGRVAIAGFVNIGAYNFVGIGATIIDNITICDNNIIGANSLVLYDIKKSGVYVGSPVRLLRNQADNIK